MDKYFNLKKKIVAKSTSIKTNEWILQNVKIFIFENDILQRKELTNYSINSIYNYDKIINLFNNSDTFSFFEMLSNFNEMLNKGYNRQFLKQNLHAMMTLPFYLFVMTALAAILTLHTMKNSENIKFIIIGLIICVFIYYFKDLSLALGKNRQNSINFINMTLVIALSFFTLVGVIQINEK